MSGEHLSIQQSLIVLVEGKDEARFISHLCDKLGLSKVQCIEYGGKSKLAAFLRSLHTIPNFQSVTGIGIVRDADESSQAAIQSVRAALSSAKLPAPDAELTLAGAQPRIAYLIAPGQGRGGAFEDMLLDAVANDAKIACIEALLACVRGSGAALRQPNKTKAWTYLACLEEPKHHVSEGCLVGAWPIDHQAFVGFKTLVELIAEPAQRTI
jgi:hypothetical protein